ncbi:hypothetical protein [Methylophilus sp. 14]|nr:hypothetical protein [Methylophilus sp. 14]MBF4988934.1 hypothetical protein [Methylophilus sp. 14]
MAISPCLDSGLRRNDEESRKTRYKQTIRVCTYDHRTTTSLVTFWGQTPD